MWLPSLSKTWRCSYCNVTIFSPTLSRFCENKDVHIWHTAFCYIFPQTFKYIIRTYIILISLNRATIFYLRHSVSETVSAPCKRFDLWFEMKFKWAFHGLPFHTELEKVRSLSQSFLPVDLLHPTLHSQNRLSVILLILHATRATRKPAQLFFHYPDYLEPRLGVNLADRSFPFLPVVSISLRM